LSQKQIAEQLGVAKSTICRSISILYPGRQKHGDQFSYEEIVRLRRVEGMRVKDVCERLGCTKNTVFRAQNMIPEE
jgi:transcriptional regulator with XRE-family HTH domain